MAELTEEHRRPGARRRFGPELIKEVCRRYQAGESGEKIAADIGVTHSTVYKWLAKNDIARRPRGSAPPGGSRRAVRRTQPVPAEKVAKATEMYCVGLHTIKQVAEACGLSQKQARQVLTAAGKQIRRGGPAKHRAEKPETVAKATEMYCVGLHTIKQVAEACGLSEKRARQVLTAAGKQIRRGGHVEDRPWKRLRRGLPPSTLTPRKGDPRTVVVPAHWAGNDRGVIQP